MSLVERNSLVSKLFFQDSASKADLLNPDLTSTYLIEVLTEILSLGYFLEITAVRTDHSNDSCLGIHSHATGRAVDCWPLYSPKAGDYMDADGLQFHHFLMDLTKIHDIAQVGLGGSAFTSSNMTILGTLGFEDNGADHVHIGE